MSHFYASIQGNRGRVTRQGTKQSGISGHIRGWNIGVQVDCYVDTNGEDVIEVALTGGSNRPGSYRSLGRHKKSELIKS